jgi:hypothetical protein
MMMHVWLARLYLFPPDNDCNNQLFTTVEEALAVLTDLRSLRGSRTSPRFWIRMIDAFLSRKMEDRYWRRSVKLMTTQAARTMARTRAGKDMPVGFRQNSNRIFCFKTARKAASPRLSIDSGQGAETADQ